MSEIKDLSIIHENGSVGSVTVVITTGEKCLITVQSEVFESSDLFAALVLFRTKLEKERWLIACNGSRLDVFPSGMAREMSRGRKAYVLKLGVRPSREDLVDIFDSAAINNIAKVSEQQAHFEQWKQSFSA